MLSRRIKKFFLEYIVDILKLPQTRRFIIRLPDLLFFYGFVRPFWKLGILCLGLSLIPTAIRSLAPLTGKVLIDFAIQKQNPVGLTQFLQRFDLGFLIDPLHYILGSVTLVMLIMLFAGLFMGLFDVISRFFMTKLQQDITYNLQVSLFDRILRYPLYILKKQQVGYLMSRATSDVGVIHSLFTGTVIAIISSLFNLCLSFAILFNLNRKIGFVILAIFPVNVLINRFYMRRMTAISYASAEESARLSSNLQEVLSGMEVIKAHVSEDRELHKISSRMRRLFNLNLKSSVLISIAAFVMGNLNRITTLFITWLATCEVMNKTITIGDLTAFIAYCTTVSGHLNSLLNTLLNLQPSLVSLDRLAEMFRIVPEDAGDVIASESIQPATIRGDIFFDRVSFSYDQHTPVLQDICFTVYSGEIVALTGVTGAGKTTLISLLLKFNHPQFGAIYLDGNDIQIIDTRWLRSRIAIVSQEVFLFNDTVEHNIKYGNPSATRGEVIRAAQSAHIHDEIEAFEQGYETLVGERGVRLSVGQRQRISLARAFLKNAPLLIFDEPTSALDPETEQLLKDSLRQLTRGRTTFIITHHMSMIDIATRVFHLTDGRILERPASNG